MGRDGFADARPAGDLADDPAGTAVCVIRDQARPYPDPPELSSDGLASAIWT